MYRGVGEGLGTPFLLSHAETFCGFVCGVVRLCACDTPKTSIFGDLDYFFVDYLFNHYLRVWDCMGFEIRFKSPVTLLSNLFWLKNLQLRRRV